MGVFLVTFIIAFSPVLKFSFYHHFRDNDNLKSRVLFACIFFTRVFHACFSCGICVQYGGFPRMKQACNAAMPMACTEGELLAKNIEKNSKKTTRRTTSAIWRIFAELKDPLSPKLAD